MSKLTIIGNILAKPDQIDRYKRHILLPEIGAQGQQKLLGAKVLAPSDPDFEKVSAYESGFNPFGDSRMKFNVRFYLVAILFIIFDIEIAFLFPFAVALDEVGVYAWAVVMIFLFELAVGYVYALKKGALDFE